VKKIIEMPSGWNKLAGHPMQAWEWGEFRKETGVGVVRYGVFESGENNSPLREVIQVTIHPIPHTSWSIGYYPKGGELTGDVEQALEEIAREYRCIYIRCEPMVEKGDRDVVHGEMGRKKYVRGRSLFTPHNFVLDVTPSEEEILKGMKQKTRYNIRLAGKKGVKVKVDNSDKAFERYLELTEETTSRQGFYAHGPRYHSTMWKVLGKSQIANSKKQTGLTAELITAKYEGKIITAWVLFAHNDTLYYPYGASTREHRNLMANNLVMWEVIKLAKSKKLKKLDMWGALGPEPDKSDPWYGFHKFKAGYGGRHVTYMGTWDYVARPLLYYPLRVVEWARWKVLRLKKK